MTRVDQLAKHIENNIIPMAVVDYTGRVDADGRIDETSSLDRRYGTRDMRHVDIYGLCAIRWNAAAREAKKIGE